ncbi:MAG: hypothetical protein NT150_00060 [Bacteroidetes bacterium]|nr:hypothetical protein [Bacteroidota bacterium]
MMGQIQNKGLWQALFMFFSFMFYYSCSSYKNLKEGKWEVDIVSIDQKNLKELKTACIGKEVNIKTDGLKMIIDLKSDCDSEGDLKLCDTFQLIPIKIDVFNGNDTITKFPEVVFNAKESKYYINKTFLKLAFGKDNVKELMAYDTNCRISWGDETLKIVYKDDLMVMYFGAYIIQCHALHAPKDNSK